MESYLNSFYNHRIDFVNAAVAIECEMVGYSRFAMIVPAALNGLTATFQVWDDVAGAWIATGQTQVLATGYWVPNATQLAALGVLMKFRMSLSAPAATAGVLQLIKKT